MHIVTHSPVFSFAGLLGLDREDAIPDVRPAEACGIAAAQSGKASTPAPALLSEPGSQPPCARRIYDQMSTQQITGAAAVE
jgi:hypothetical protein